MSRIRIKAGIAVLIMGGIMAGGAARAGDTLRPDPDLEAARRRFGPTAEAPPSPPSNGGPAQPMPAGPPEGVLQPALDAAVQGQGPLDPAAATAFALETQRRVDEEARKGLAGFDPNGLSKRLQSSAAAVDGWLSHLPPGPPHPQPAH